MSRRAYASGLRDLTGAWSVGDDPPTEGVEPGHRWWDTVTNLPYYFDPSRDLWLGPSIHRQFFHDAGGSATLPLKFEISGFASIPEVIGMPMEHNCVVVSTALLCPTSSWTCTIDIGKSTYDGTAGSQTTVASVSLSSGNVAVDTSHSGATKIDARQLLTAEVSSGSVPAMILHVGLRPYHLP